MSLNQESYSEIQHVNRDFKGIWIPREIWLMPDLLPGEKILWAEIHSLYDREKGGCFASNDYLSKFMQVKERRLQEMIANLVKHDLIVHVSFDGRRRIMKAVTPKEDFKIPKKVKKQRTSEVQKSAPQRCIIMHPCDELKCTPHYIYNKEDNKEYIHSPTSQENYTKGTANSSPNGESVCADSFSKEEKKKPQVFSDTVEDITAKMVKIATECNPMYRPPKDLTAFKESIRLMLEEDGLAPDQMLAAFEWAAKDTVERGDFKGWQCIILCNSSTRGKANPGEKFRRHASKIYSQMKSRKERKFAPSSDQERAMKALTEMEKRAL